MTAQRMPRKAEAPPHPITNSSGKPEEIPLDILNACADACREAGWPPVPQYMRPLARALMADRERFRPLLTTLYSDVVWNAYHTGIERDDGKWIDAGMSDAEQLRRDLGVADVPQPVEAMRLALPGLIERKVAAAIRTPTQAHADAGGDTL